MGLRRPGVAAHPDPAPADSSDRRLPGMHTRLSSPAAARTTWRRWADPRLALGLAVIAACSLLGARALGAADDTVSVWAAQSTLEPGQHVAAEDLVRRDVRFDDQADADRYLSADSGLPVDATVDRAVGTGELLPRSAVGAATAGPVTEVPVSVGAQGVPAGVRTGSTVDVWVTPDPAAADAQGPTDGSSLVFHGVRVLSVPETSTSLGPTATRSVTVGVDRRQSAQLPESLSALAGGDVTLTVRR